MMLSYLFVVKIVLKVIIFRFKLFVADQILFDSFVSLFKGHLIILYVEFKTFLNGQFVSSTMLLNFAMLEVTKLLFDDHSLIYCFLLHIF